MDNISWLTIMSPIRLFLIRCFIYARLAGLDLQCKKTGVGSAERQATSHEPKVWMPAVSPDLRLC